MRQCVYINHNLANSTLTLCPYPYKACDCPEVKPKVAETPAQTFYAIKRDEEPSYFDFNAERWRESVQFCLDSKDYLTRVLSHEANEHLKTARIVRVEVMEIDE